MTLRRPHHPPHFIPLPSFLLSCNDTLCRGDHIFWVIQRRCLSEADSILLLAPNRRDTSSDWDQEGAGLQEAMRSLSDETKVGSTLQLDPRLTLGLTLGLTPLSFSAWFQRLVPALSFSTWFQRLVPALGFSAWFQRLVSALGFSA